jgi:hypothetical protein
MKENDIPIFEIKLFGNVYNLKLHLTINIDTETLNLQCTSSLSSVSVSH